MFGLKSVQAGLKPGLLIMASKAGLWYSDKRTLKIAELAKVFRWKTCDIWHYIPEIGEAFVHVVDIDGEKWFFNNGLLKWFKPGKKIPEYYSWAVIAETAIKLGDPDPAIELGGLY